MPMDLTGLRDSRSTGELSLDLRRSTRTSSSIAGVFQAMSEVQPEREMVAYHIGMAIALDDVLVHYADFLEYLEELVHLRVGDDEFLGYLIDDSSAIFDAGDSGDDAEADSEDDSGLASDLDVIRQLALAGLTEQIQDILTEALMPHVECADLTDLSTEQVQAEVQRTLIAIADRGREALQDWRMEIETINLRVDPEASLPAFLGDFSELRTLSVTADQRTAVGQADLVPLQVLQLRSPLTNVDTFSVSSLVVDVSALSSALPELLRLEADDCVIESSGNDPEPLMAFSILLRYCEIRAWTVAAPVCTELIVVGTILDADSMLLKHFVALEVLDLGRCALSEMPDIPDGTPISELAAADNDFHAATFENLLSISSTLRRLDISGCGISSLPAPIFGMDELASLDLSLNPLSSLPSELGELENLSTLELTDVSLPPLLAKAAELGTEDLKAFLREMGPSPTECHEGKMLVIGEGNVGKSSLVAALRGDPFIEGRPTTHGIDVLRLDLTDLSTDTNDDPQETVVTAWDFGGQKIYRVTHPFFFSPDAIFVVTWRPRDGLEDVGLQYWLEAIKHRVGLTKCAVLLVSTYRDEGRSTDFDVEQLTYEYYPALQGYFSVDNQSGLGIDDLREAIARCIQNLPHYGSPIPESWQALRSAFSEIADPVLDLVSFGELTSEVGVGAREARSCARLLHVLGDILFFDERDGLAPLVVVDPELLTQAVSFVLEDGRARGATGLMNSEHIVEVWRESGGFLSQRQDLYGSLLQLIRRFDVAYQVEAAGDDQLFFPELLPVARPLDLPWEPEDALPGAARQVQVRIAFKADPVGLVPWMIVRSARLLTNHQWRNGALFEHSQHDAQALLDYDAGARTLTLTVRGGFPFELFSVLHSDIDHLLETRWPNLPREATLPCPNSRAARHCLGRFPVEFVRRALASGRDTGDCRVCLADVQLSEVLVGLPMAVSLGGRLTRIEETVTDIRGQVESGSASIASAIGELSHSLRMLREEVLIGGTDTPVLVTVVPTVRGSLAAVIRRREYSIQLWCEYEGGPHPVGQPYVEKVPPKWVEEAYPILRVISRILSLVPVISTGLTAAVTDAEWKDVLESLDFIDALGGFLGDLPGDAEHTDGGDSVEAGAARSSASGRAIRELLLAVDAAREFRDLRPVVAPGRPVMWLCGEHASAYPLATRPSLESASGGAA